jgi:CRISPR-associated protein Cas2
MYYIVVYDINEKRVNKMLKLCRQYLHWVQNSTFEGELTPVQMAELKMRAKQIMINEEDSLIIYKIRSDKYLDKEMMGKDKSDLTSNFI